MSKHLSRITLISLMILIVSGVTCKANDDKAFKLFYSSFVQALVEQNEQELKKHFSSSIAVWVYEIGCTLTSKNDYEGYSDKSGMLYNILFKSNKMKPLFGYENLCFADAFKKQKEIFSGLEPTFGLIWIIIDNYRYDLFFEKKNSEFFLNELKLSEK